MSVFCHIFQTQAKNNGNNNTNSGNVDSNSNNKNCSASGNSNNKVANSCTETSVTFKENKHDTTNLKSSMKDIITSRRKELKLDSSPELSRTMERFIDEKCNLLNKRGISKGGTTHLARWMKGQFDKQACASEPIESDDDEETDNSREWSVDDVKRRTKELNLAQSQMQSQSSQKQADEMTSEDEQNDKSASKSTTSDSQVSLVPKFLFSKKTCITFEQTKNS